MSLAPCPSEVRMQRLTAARRWLNRCGVSCKVDLDVTPPVPRYQLSGGRGWLTADGVIAEAVARGWRE